MVKNKLVIPFVKWVGGKRQLLDEIIPLLPKHFTTYCEPFLGGGAVLFSIQPSKAIVSDLNIDLITAYEVIRDDVEALIESLKKHENTTEYFYAVRDMDMDKTSYQALSRIEKASRLIYLNKTCFNGLFRVNSSGEFNSPFGHYKNP
ncbi:MAG: Dam family site-specific DNA-(adenine-N6)-methyltransferase [Eubacteriales bacterium]|nr:Dam family site-specific DNA-(adenine-N6)-methyltransferase [Eubacteriales bacterium]